MKWQYLKNTLGKRLSCAMLAVASMRVLWLEDLNLFQMPNLWACNSSEIEGWFGWSDKQATWCWFQVAHTLYGHELFRLLHTSHFYHMLFKVSLGPGSYLSVGFFSVWLTNSTLLTKVREKLLLWLLWHANRSHVTWGIGFASIKRESIGNCMA
jgi:hypothetical protein